jgi:hypothetical protein
MGCIVFKRADLAVALGLLSCSCKAFVYSHGAIGRKLPVHATNATGKDPPPCGTLLRWALLLETVQSHSS